MSKIIIIFCLLSIPSLSPAFAYRDTTTCMQILEQIEASYNGRTENDNTYKLYAIKNKKEWIFLVTDSTHISSFAKTKKGALNRQDNFYRDNTCKIVENKWLIKHEERTSVDGLALFCYYTFTKEGQKFYTSYKRVNTLNSVQEKTGFFKTIWNVIKAPFTLIFGRKKVNTIDQQIRTTEGLQQQVESTQKGVDQVKEKTEEIKEKKDNNQ
ncbi:MAG: hypothetical protein ACFB0B_23090 [Thermonemataceae bacterium]